MKGPLTLASLRNTAMGWFAQVRDARFFHDRLSLALLVGALIVNGLNVVALGLKVRPTDVPVPTQYSNIGGGFSALGPWYFPFTVAAVALAVTVGNAAFAYFGFNRSRLASFFLLASSGVVAIFSFIISMAFGAIG